MMGMPAFLTTLLILLPPAELARTASSGDELGSRFLDPGPKVALAWGSAKAVAPDLRAEIYANGRSDLFSLGCIAYECLTGQRPFDGDQITAILLKIVNEDPPPIDYQSLGLPESTLSVLRRALDKDPAHGLGCL